MNKISYFTIPIILGLAMALAALGFLAPPTAVRAAGPWYVNATTGNDSNDCLSTTSACKTIGGAIGKASSGDTINIAAGVYTETNTISGKSLILVGAGINQTIVDGDGDYHAIFRVNSSASATLSDMTLQNGGATGGGSAIYAAGPVTVSHVSISNNLANFGSMLVYSTTAVILNSTFSDNHVSNTSYGRDGIFAETNAKVSISNSTFSGNQSVSVHIQNKTTLAITNTTFSTNGGYGLAVIEVSGNSTATINASTVADNKSYGIWDNGTVIIQNSIVFHNDSVPYSGTENNCGSDSSILPISLGYNIDGGTSCNFSATGDITSTNPLLLPLGDYGGNTQTRGLSFNSPALDAGSPTTCPSTDQRGTERPQDGNGDSAATCDIGAFELLRQTLTGVTISGDSEGLVNSSHTFVATILPVTATQPITYIWNATNQTTPITHTGKGITDSVSFSWSSEGAKVITVTVNNGLGSQTDTHAFTVTTGIQSIADVSIAGATAGSLAGTHTFTATVSPSNATLPITYTWQADGQSSITHTVSGISDAVSFHWTSEGTKTITVTVANVAGSKVNTHTIRLWRWYVNAANGNDSNDCQSAATACKTIGGAIGKAGDGDLITVAAGVYTETNTLNKSLTITGAGRDQTIVDGDVSGSVFRTNFNTVVSLSQMTIRNGGGYSSGGGVYVSGELTLSHVRVFSNTGSHGSAIFITGSGSVTATHTTFDHNKTTATYVGAIFVDGGKLWLESSTLSENSTQSIHNQNGGTVDIFNSTISGNTGGIVNGGTLTMRNSTVANNSPGNAISNSGTFTVKSSILAAPTGVNVCDTTSFGTVNLTSQGYNLESTNTCGLNATGDKTGAKPYLQPLADNGGDTKTHALLRASPALDGSDASVCSATDQRGTARPIDGDGDGTATCDIGAFESPLVHWMVYLPLVVK